MAVSSSPSRDRASSDPAGSRAAAGPASGRNRASPSRSEGPMAAVARARPAWPARPPGLSAGACASTSASGRPRGAALAAVNAPRFIGPQLHVEGRSRPLRPACCGPISAPDAVSCVGHRHVHERPRRRVRDSHRAPHRGAAEGQGAGAGDTRPARCRARRARHQRRRAVEPIGPAPGRAEGRLTGGTSWRRISHSRRVGRAARRTALVAGGQRLDQHPGRNRPHQVGARLAHEGSRPAVSDRKLDADARRDLPAPPQRRIQRRPGSRRARR